MVEPLEEPISEVLWDLHWYWCSKRDQAFAPPWSAISVAEMKPWLSYLALVDVVGDEPRFRVRLFGAALVEAYGEEISGRFMDDCDLNYITEQMQEQMLKVVCNGAPNVIHARFTKIEDGRYLDYERIALPLSDDGEHVNMILCGYKIYWAT
jgi:hypothetical protein